MTGPVPAPALSPSADAAAPAGTRGTLGTFAGVFTPSVLTILGIILFLRLGYVVGEAGLGRALLIIVLANVISVLTSVSLATIATNLHVKGGGDYYVISRTLGVEYGGALGLALFLAQAISIAFYAIGFGEAVAAVTATAHAWLPQVVAAAAVLGLFGLAWFGADVATRFQFVIMAVLAAGLIGFFAGGLPQFDPELLESNWAPAGDVPFWVLFALFFPAITGFTQGVSMSGDLADPARSLPRGTFAAVGLSVLVYFGVAVVFAGTVAGAELASDTNAMRRVSILPVLVDAGVIAATLSSALASFLGAPRILQSLASDRVFPFLSFFAAGSGPAQNPRRGVLLAGAIALVTISLGSLNLIAPVVAMFFLISYGLLNYATWFEARGGSPSFRPTFRWFHPRLCLAGALACLGAMLAINAIAGIVSLAVLFGVQQYVKRTATRRRWADSERSFNLQRIREQLLALADKPEHSRDWRPVIIAFSDNPDRRARTIRFASWIEGRSGFTTAVTLLAGEGAAARMRREEAEEALRRDIRERKLEAFARVTTSPDTGESMPLVLQAHGIGAIRANTVLLNWFDHAPGPDDPPGLERYGHYLRQALRFGCHVVILGAETKNLESVDATPPGARRIDVWYEDERDGGLMLLFAYLMTRTPDWEQARIRVLAPRAPDRTTAEAREALGTMLAEVRIPAEPVIVGDWSAEEAVRDSGDATVVFLPFTLNGDSPGSPFEGSLQELVDKLQVVALVRAVHEVELDAEPESGAPGEIAAAEERAAHTEKTARKAAKEAEAAAETALDARDRVVEQLVSSEAAPEEIEAARREASAADEEAEAKRRRALKNRAKAEEARKEVDEIAGEGEPEEEPPEQGT